MRPGVGEVAFYFDEHRELQAARAAQDTVLAPIDPTFVSETLNPHSRSTAVKFNPTNLAVELAVHHGDEVATVKQLFEATVALDGVAGWKARLNGNKRTATKSLVKIENILDFHRQQQQEY